MSCDLCLYISLAFLLFGFPSSLSFLSFLQLAVVRNARHSFRSIIADCLLNRVVPLHIVTRLVHLFSNFSKNLSKDTNQP